MHSRKSKQMQLAAKVPWWHHNSTAFFRLVRQCMGMMKSLLRIFRARSILWSFVVPKLILLFAAEGWSAQPDSITFGSYYYRPLQTYFLQLNDNNICQVEKSAFEDTSSLHSLSLSNNRLTRLHQSTFDKIQDNIARLEISGGLTSIFWNHFYILGSMLIKDSAFFILSREILNFKQWFIS